MADMLINPNRYKANLQKRVWEREKGPAFSFWKTEDKAPKTILDYMKPEEKTPSVEEIRARIDKIRSDLRAGKRLSPEDRAYLSKYAQEELQKMVQVERERVAFQARLSACETREEAKDAFASASNAASMVDPKDPDLASVIVGQLAAEMRSMGDKPTNAQLKRLEQGRIQGYDRRA